MEVDSGGHPRCCSGRCSSRPQPARAGRVGASEEALGGGNLTTRRAKRGTIVEVQPGPEAIYFTLPTICDQLPALDPDEAAAALEVRPLADDEWRQIEFVSIQDWTPIHEALDELARVEPNPVHAPLLSALYVRDELPTSLASLEIPAEAVRTELPTRTFTPRLRLATADGVGAVRGGFAAFLNDLGTVYGVLGDDVVKTLALHPFPSEYEIDEDAIERVARFCDRYGLLLVDWCRTTTVEINPVFLVGWLERARKLGRVLIL